MPYMLLLFAVLALLGANYKSGPLTDFTEALIALISVTAIAAALFPLLARRLTQITSQLMLSNFESPALRETMAALGKVPGLPRLRFEDRMLAHRGVQPAELLEDPFALSFYHYYAAARACGLQPLPPPVVLFFSRLPLLVILLVVLLPAGMIVLPGWAIVRYHEVMRSAWFYVALAPIFYVLALQFLQRKVMVDSYAIAAQVQIGAGRLDSSVLDR